MNREKEKNSRLFIGNARKKSLLFFDVTGYPFIRPTIV